MERPGRLKKNATLSCGYRPFPWLIGPLVERGLSVALLGHDLHRPRQKDGNLYVVDSKHGPSFFFHFHPLLAIQKPWPIIRAYSLIDRSHFTLGRSKLFGTPSGLTHSRMPCRLGRRARCSAQLVKCSRKVQSASSAPRDGRYTSLTWTTLPTEAVKR
jgi:hypothetical protein